MPAATPPHPLQARLPASPTTRAWWPADGSSPQQLMLLLHGWGASPDDLAPLAQALRAAFPQSAVLAPEGFDPVDTGLAGRQWFSLAGITEANRPLRVQPVLPRLASWVQAVQAATGVGAQATALVGFSQGAILALELAQLHDGIAGRVLAFSGRYASLPAVAPARTTLHFFHGATDTVIPAAQSRLAIERLAALQGDATIDIAHSVGHELAPVLVDCALHRLTHHIPARTWAEALGAAPRGAGDALDD